MKHTLKAVAASIVVAAFSAAASAAVDATKAQAALKEHRCLTCHAVDKAKVGPAYQEVAAKYKGKSVADLTASMKSKSEHAGVLKKTSDDDLNMMLEWVLSLAK